MQLNKLLQRQILKYIGSKTEIPEEFSVLLKVISESYNHYEKDRNMLERSIDLSSKELIDLNLKLRKDILEREKTQKELTGINQRLTYHLNNTPLAVIEWDSNLIVTHWNDRAEELFGWKKEQVLGQSLSSLNMIYENDISSVATVSEGLVNGSIISHINENRNYTSSGEILTCEWYNSALKDEAGNVTTILSLVKDVTERKKSEEKLQNLNNNLTLLFENIDDVLFSVDMVNYRVLQISPSCEKIYGYKPEEFFANGNLWYQVINPEDKKNADNQLQLLNSGKRVLNQYRINHKDGSVHWLENKLIPTLNGSGKLVRIDGLTSDVTLKMLNDRSLKESNERYELVTRATNDAIWDWNFETNKLYWSEGYEKLFGYKNSSEEQNVSIWTERIYIEDKKRITGGILEKIKESNSDFWEDEYRYYRADGTIAHVHDRAFIVYDSNRKPIRMVGAMQDITKQKKAENHLQKSEANLRNILENTDTAYVLLDEKGKVLSFNKLAMLLAEQENIGKIEEGGDYVEMMPEHRRGEVESILKNVLECGRKLSYEVKYEHVDKTYTWLHVSMHPIFNANNEVTGMSIATTNITSRKKSEKLLLKSEANLRTIFNNTNIAYVLLDRRFKIVSFNETAAAGYKKELNFDLVERKNLIEYLPPEKREFSRKRYERVLRGEKLNYELSFGNPNESLTWYNINMFPVFDNSKNILGFIISSEDITIRKSAQLERERITADLIQRNRDLQQFAYIVSHNLRSPVANIIGLSNLITQSQGIKKADQNKLVEGLGLSTKKLDEVIRDLNHILQVRGAIIEKREIIKFSDLTQDIQSSISALLAKENVVIETDFSEIDSLFTLKSYMNSIFYNLISNSIKYRSITETPQISIQTHKENNKIFITFKDNGLGIDLRNNENKVFGLYKKFHSHIEGKGMGLYMVKTQVEILGGRIAIESEVNKGTKFLIELET